MNWLQRQLSKYLDIKGQIRKELPALPEEVENRIKQVISPPGSRTSHINEGKNPVKLLQKKLAFVTPQYNTEAIPIIRKLAKVNEDMALALLDIVQLTNTGHQIRFDQSMDAEVQDKMRKHLAKRSATWMDGVSGIDGIVNKLIAQVWVGGAISAEMVPTMNLRGISTIGMVNPEEIRFAIKNGRYVPYQLTKYWRNINEQKGYIKLNEDTYKYYALITDEEIPYGIPPFLSAINTIAAQDKMEANIEAVLELLGVLGFLQVGIEKPDQHGDESETAYQTRLKSLLNETKDNVLEGFKDGISVGYKEDHEYEFHSTTANIQGTDVLLGHVNQKVANSLKTHAAFLGGGGKTETHLSIVFTKMLSQLSNVQRLVSHFLCQAYEMELRLAGFRPQGLKVEFKPSTFTDDLKYQQSQEIKIRNLQAKYDQGIINQDQFAEECGYDRADQEEPRVTRETNVMAPGSKADPENRGGKKKEKRDERDKKKPQPRRRDNK